MTREQIVARKQELEGMRQQAFENFQRLWGAVLDCDYWLAELDKPQEKP